MNLFELFVKIGADTSQAEKGMENTQKNAETLTNKIKVMSAQFETAQKNVDKLTQEFNEAVNKTDAASKETQELAKKLDDTEKEAKQAETSLERYNSELEETKTKAEKAGGGLSNFASKLGKGLATAAKIGTAAVTAAAAGITALTTAAVKNYAEYEQLVGGVETLFKDSADTVQQYASDAFRTAGMSANSYMETITSFSASLLQSLGGDTEAATEYANQAITDMSDNANKMGTSIEMIQNAYQGFAKQNYTMLDNLKLGYGGTATEMARLINDSGILGDNLIDLSDTKTIGLELQELGFAKITEAIHIIQTQMGITGTTALEASQTISGSFASMKAAWQNLLTGIADPNQKFGDMIDNLVKTASTFVGNVLPVAKDGLIAILKLARNIVPKLVKELPGIVEEVFPLVANTALDVINTFLETIDENAGDFIAIAIPIVENLANGILDLLPRIASIALNLISALANGLVDNNTLSELIPAVVGVIVEIFNIITEPENMKIIHEAASALLVELANGIGDAIPLLVDGIVAIIENIALFLTDPENLGTLINAALKIVIAIAGGLISAAPRLVLGVVELIGKVVDQFVNTDWAQVGTNIVNGLGEGLSKAWQNIKNWAKSAWDGIVGFFTGESASINVPVYTPASSSVANAGGSYTRSSPMGVNVVQNIYSQKQTAADLMEEALYAQNRAVYLS